MVAKMNSFAFARALVLTVAVRHGSSVVRLHNSTLEEVDSASMGTTHHHRKKETFV